MKRLVIGSAVAVMLAASVADVDAGPFDWGTGSGRSGAGKKTKVFGEGNKDTRDMFNCYYRSAKDEATEARVLVKKIKDALTAIKGETKKAKEVNLCINAWQKVDVALESIQSYRKVDDIKPDCEDALKEIAKSTNDLAKLVGEDAFEPLRKLFEKWPSPQSVKESTFKEPLCKRFKKKAPSPYDTAMAVYKLYEAIQNLAKSAAAKDEKPAVKANKEEAVVEKTEEKVAEKVVKEEDGTTEEEVKEETKEEDKATGDQPEQAVVEKETPVKERSFVMKEEDREAAKKSVKAKGDDKADDSEKSDLYKSVERLANTVKAS